MGVGATGIWLVKAKDAGKLPTMHRTAPPTRNYPIKNVNSAKVEKLSSIPRVCKFFP